VLSRRAGRGSAQHAGRGASPSLLRAAGGGAGRAAPALLGSAGRVRQGARRARVRAAAPPRAAEEAAARAAATAAGVRRWATAGVVPPLRSARPFLGLGLGLGVRAPRTPPAKPWRQLREPVRSPHPAAAPLSAGQNDVPSRPRVLWTRASRPTTRARRVRRLHGPRVGIGTTVDDAGSRLRAPVAGRCSARAETPADSLRAAQGAWMSRSAVPVAQGPQAEAWTLRLPRARLSWPPK
jgi:hypothetical protein